MRRDLIIVSRHVLERIIYLFVNKHIDTISLN